MTGLSVTYILYIISKISAETIYMPFARTNVLSQKIPTPPRNHLGRRNDSNVGSHSATR